MKTKKLIVSILILILVVSINYYPVGAVEAIPLKELEMVEEVLYGGVQEPAIMGKVENLEVTLFGEKGNGSLKERADRIIDYVFNSDKQPSLILYINILEWTLKNRIVRDNLLDRLGELEEMVYGKVKEGSLADRAENLVKLSLIEGELPVGQVTMLAGTRLNVRLLNDINTAEVKLGQLVEYEVIKDIKIDDYLVIPAGTRGLIKIDKISQAGNFGKDAEISLSLPELFTIDGSKVPVEFSLEETKTYSREAAFGIGLLGLIITSHPVGLAIGYFYKGRDINIPRGSELTIEVSKDVATYGLNF